MNQVLFGYGMVDLLGSYALFVQFVCPSGCVHYRDMYIMDIKALCTPLYIIVHLTKLGVRNISRPPKYKRE